MFCGKKFIDNIKSKNYSEAILNLSDVKNMNKTLRMDTIRMPIYSYVLKQKAYPVLDHMLMKGLTFNSVQPHSQTNLLGTMALMGEVEPLRLLLKYGLHGDSKDIRGETLLYLVTSKGNVECIKYLLKHDQNIDLNCKNNDLTTPIYATIGADKKDAFDLLLEHGADTDVQCKRGNSLFHIFSFYDSGKRLKNLTVAKEILERGVSINTRNNLGNTPLMQACRDENVELVKFFLELGADMQIKNNKGENIFLYKYSSERIKLEIKTLLLETKEKRTEKKRLLV